jgi:hypothetical protein
LDASIVSLGLRTVILKCDAIQLRQPIRYGVPRRLAVHVNVQFRPQSRIVVEAPRGEFDQRRARECIRNPGSTTTAETRVIGRRSRANRSCVHTHEFLALQKLEILGRDQDTCCKCRSGNLSATRTVTEFERPANLPGLESNTAAETTAMDHWICPLDHGDILPRIRCTSLAATDLR